MPVVIVVVMAAVTGDLGILGELGDVTENMAWAALVLEPSLMKKSLRLRMSTFLGQQNKLFREAK